MKTVYIPVSVEDELPDANKNYFVIYDGGRQNILMYNKRGVWTDSWEIEYTVTHWLKPIQIPDDKFIELLK